MKRLDPPAGTPEVFARAALDLDRSAMEAAIEDETGLTGDAAWLVDLVVTSLRENRRLSDHERAVAAEHARRWARARLEWRTLSAAVHRVTHIARRSLVECLGALDDEPPAELGAVIAGLELLSEVELDVLEVVEAAMRGAEAERSQDRRDALVCRLLERPLVNDPAGAARRSAAIRAGLVDALHVVALAERADRSAKGTFEERVRRCTAPVPEITVGPLFPTPDAGGIEVGFLLMGSAGPTRVDALLAELRARCDGADLLVVHAPSSLGELFVAATRLRYLVHLLVRVGDRVGWIVEADTLLSFEAVTGLTPGTRAALVRSRLGPLVTGLSDGSLSETLDTLWEMCQGLPGGAAAAAERLYVHANTVYNRIATIRGLSGFDPDLDRTSFHLALSDYYLSRDDLPSPADPWWSAGAARPRPLGPEWR